MCGTMLYFVCYYLNSFVEILFSTRDIPQDMYGVFTRNGTPQDGTFLKTNVATALVLCVPFSAKLLKLIILIIIHHEIILIYK